MAVYRFWPRARRSRHPQRFLWVLSGCLLDPQAGGYCAGPRTSVEVYSIDASFLGLNGLGNLWLHAAGIGQFAGAYANGQDCRVCVGIGSAKTLAKLANHIAKKNSRFDGMRDLASVP